MWTPYIFRRTCIYIILQHFISENLVQQNLLDKYEAHMVVLLFPEALHKRRSERFWTYGSGPCFSAFKNITICTSHGLKKASKVQTTLCTLRPRTLCFHQLKFFFFPSSLGLLILGIYPSPLLCFRVPMQQFILSIHCQQVGHCTDPTRIHVKGFIRHRPSKVFKGITNDHLRPL